MPRATGPRTLEWVDKPEDATADVEESREVILKQFKGAQLERASKKTPQHEPGWIISKET
jgi:hypothetical protein